jgi:hypothetical protein
MMGREKQRAALSRKEKTKRKERECTWRREEKKWGA